MAKKTTPTSAKASTQPTAKPASKSKIVQAPALTIESAVAKPARAAKPSETDKKPAAAKKVAAKPVAAKKAPASKAPADTAKSEPVKAPNAQVSLDDVALRAYFISEKRRAHGIAGNEHQDWIDAEREIQAELQPKAKAKKS